MSDPALRIRLIENSMNSFLLGLAGLIPVAGLPFGICAIVISFGVRSKAKGNWNPGHSYATAGAILGLVGLGGSAIVGILFQIWFYEHYVQGRF